MALGEDGSLVSQTLGIAFRPDGESLRMTDVATGQPVLSHEDLKESLHAVEDARRAAEERAAEEQAARHAAENRAAEAEAQARELAEELERLRAETQNGRVDAP